MFWVQKLCGHTDVTAASQLYWLVIALLPEHCCGGAGKTGSTFASQAAGAGDSSGFAFNPAANGTSHDASASASGAAAFGFGGAGEITPRQGKDL